MSSHRLAEVLGGLSLATDVAAGVPPETAIRTAVYAVRLGRAAGLQGFELQECYYVGLLRFIGCTAFAHELAGAVGGDDLSAMTALTPSDPTRPLDALVRIYRGTAPGRRARATLGLLSNPKGAQQLARSHCDLAAALAARLGMSEGVARSLAHAYERWDGRGPDGARGDAIDHKARILHVAWRLAAHLAIEGLDAALELLSSRRGTELDPKLCTLALQLGPELMEVRDPLWERFLDEEPRPQLAATELRRVASAFAHFVDVKSPYLLGHSFGVARLAAAAAPDGEAERLELAGLLHDLGRVAVPNGIWDKPGPLSPSERMRAREHASETARILGRATLLEPFARLCVRHHERLDESGYPAGTGSLTPAERVLAAADVYQALTEARPHRPAHASEAAARLLREEATAGRLCTSAVESILAAAGHARQRPARPAGLSDREVEVLAAVARGLGNKEIARTLFISGRTVQRHLENIFDKTGVRTRAAAAVFAIEHGLV